MDILIVIDKKDKKKFIKRAEKIKEMLEQRKIKVRGITTTKFLNINNKTMCLLFSNDAAYVKEICIGQNSNAICITSRLEASYILEILEVVKDIHFLNTSTEEICERILGYINLIENRRKCMKNEFYFAEK